MFRNYVADADKANAAGNEFLANTGTCWVDVRDVAEAHALALEKEAAGGERIIISKGKSVCCSLASYQLNGIQYV